MGACKMENNTFNRFRKYQLKADRDMWFHYWLQLPLNMYLWKLVVNGIQNGGYNFICNTGVNTKFLTSSGRPLKEVNFVQNKLLKQCDSCEHIKAHGPLVQLLISLLFLVQKKEKMNEKKSSKFRSRWPSRSFHDPLLKMFFSICLQTYWKPFVKVFNTNCTFCNKLSFDYLQVDLKTVFGHEWDQNVRMRDILQQIKQKIPSSKGKGGNNQPPDGTSY